MSSNPNQATSFLFFSTKMITFVLCNICECIWYSEFILRKVALNVLRLFVVFLDFINLPRSIEVRKSKPDLLHLFAKLYVYNNKVASKLQTSLNAPFNLYSIRSFKWLLGRLWWHLFTGQIQGTSRQESKINRQKKIFTVFSWGSCVMPVKRLTVKSVL